MKKVDELSAKIRVIYTYSHNAHRNSAGPNQRIKSKMASTQVA